MQGAGGVRWLGSIHHCSPRRRGVGETGGKAALCNWPAVTSEIDSNGIFNVRVEDKDTAKSEKITVTYDWDRLTKEQFGKKFPEPDQFAAEDMKVKECADARIAFVGLRALRGAAEGSGERAQRVVGCGCLAVEQIVAWCHISSADRGGDQLADRFQVRFSAFDDQQGPTSPGSTSDCGREVFFALKCGVFSDSVQVDVES